MAEGDSVNIQKELCPFYLYSSCQDGDRCKFAHDATCRNLEKVVCGFFLKGICKYGDNCWYSHTKLKDNINSTPEIKRSSQRTNSELNKCKKNLNSLNNSNCAPNSPNWVNAPEFVPKTNKTYSNALKTNDCIIESELQKLDMEFCMHFFEGVCPYGDECPCLHGDLCELCNKYCLNPFNELQRNRHMKECEKELEQHMEFSFAVQRSLDKTCGICMDVIMEKESPAERLFGILENCNHVYCLPCIRQWRSVEKFEIAQDVEHLVDPVVTRSCPECRVSSYFITPSKYWVDSESEKKKLIADYKLALSKKHCKYFKHGDGTCPFGGACFYLHVKRDGTKVVLPMPTRRRRLNQDGELDYMENVSLWDFLEERDDSGFEFLDQDELSY